MKHKADMNHVIDMDMLLIYCSQCPELYNKVFRILCDAFGNIPSPALTLLCTYVARESIEGDKE